MALAQAVFKGPHRQLERHLIHKQTAAPRRFRRVGYQCMREQLWVVAAHIHARDQVLEVSRRQPAGHVTRPGHMADLHAGIGAGEGIFQRALGQGPGNVLRPADGATLGALEGQHEVVRVESRVLGMVQAQLPLQGLACIHIDGFKTVQEQSAAGALLHALQALEPLTIALAIGAARAL